MDVYQLTLKCASCSVDARVILSSGVSPVFCPNCNELLVRSKRFAGVVYVLHNARVGGVKIGMTQGDVFRRARQLSGTGVPGEFTVVAVFPSSNPLRDERKVHAKLIRHRIAKEHFELDPVKAAVRVRTILGKDPTYLDRKYGEAFSALVQKQKESARAKFGQLGLCEAGEDRPAADDRQLSLSMDTSHPESSPASHDRNSAEEHAGAGDANSGGAEAGNRTRGFLANLFFDRR